MINHFDKAACFLTPADQVREIERSRLRSLVSRDMETAWQLHSPDFQLVTPTGITFTRERYLNRVAAGGFYLRWEPGHMEVRMRSDAAVIRYQATLELDAGTGAGTPFQCWHLDTYELNGQYWQVVWSQATIIKKPE